MVALQPRPSHLPKSVTERVTLASLLLAGLLFAHATAGAFETAGGSGSAGANETAGAHGTAGAHEKDASFAIQLLKSVDDLKALDAEGLFYLGMAYIKGDQSVAGVEALQRSLLAGLPDALSLKAKAAIDEANKPE